MEIQAADVIAGLLGISSFILIAMGKNSTSTAVLLAITAYYFGRASKMTLFRR